MIKYTLSLKIIKQWWLEKLPGKLAAIILQKAYEQKQIKFYANKR